jgi:hypothetical protein
MFNFVKVAASWRKEDRWIGFLAGTVAMQLVVFLFSPRFALQPRPVGYWLLVGISLFLLFLPFGWSIFLLFIYRSLPERIVAYVSLAASVLWLMSAQLLLYFVLKDSWYAG